MSMQYVRDHYKVPAKRGMRVDFYALSDLETPRVQGRIVSAKHNLRVREGKKVWTIHPTYNVVYFDDDGNVLMDTREAKQ